MIIPACRQMQNMLNSPQFLQQMTSVFSNPQLMDQINSQMRGLDPHMRQMFQSERFRQMMYVEFRCPPSPGVLSYPHIQVESRYSSNDAANVQPDGGGRISR